MVVEFGMESKHTCLHIVPGTEAHGGYTFCGFAALSLLKKTHLCDIRRLLVRKTAIFLTFHCTHQVE